MGSGEFVGVRGGDSLGSHDIVYRLQTLLAEPVESRPPRGWHELRTEAQPTLGPYVQHLESARQPRLIISFGFAAH